MAAHRAIHPGRNWGWFPNWVQRVSWSLHRSLGPLGAAPWLQGAGPVTSRGQGRNNGLIRFLVLDVRIVMSLQPFPISSRMASALQLLSPVGSHPL